MHSYCTDTRTNLRCSCTRLEEESGCCSCCQAGSREHDCRTTSSPGKSTVSFVNTCHLGLPPPLAAERPRFTKAGVVELPTAYYIIVSLSTGPKACTSIIPGSYLTLQYSCYHYQSILAAFVTRRPQNRIGTYADGRPEAVGREGNQNTRVSIFPLHPARPQPPLPLLGRPCRGKTASVTLRVVLSPQTSKMSWLTSVQGHQFFLSTDQGPRSCPT